jgi:hypothetical protein
LLIDQLLKKPFARRKNWLNRKLSPLFNLVMEKSDKLSPSEIAGLIVILLILLYFPYKMITEHQLDIAANSHYHAGR